MLNKCKVLNCNNSIMEIKDNYRHDTMKNTYGYCQIHTIEGLVYEIKGAKDEK